MQNAFTQFIKSRRLATVLILSLSLPIGLAMMLGAQKIWQENRALAQIMNVDEVVHVGIDAVGLVDALRDERAALTPYLILEGEMEQSAFNAVFDHTDKIAQDVVAEFQQLLLLPIAARTRESVMHILEKTAQLGTVRQAVLDQSITHQDMLDWYTDLNFDMINCLEDVIAFSEQNKVSYHVLATVYFLNASEYMAVEQAVGRGAFALGRWNNDQNAIVKDVSQRQPIFFDKFIRIASPRQAKAFDAFYNGENLETLANLRNTVLAGGMFGDMMGFDAPMYDALYQEINAQLSGLEMMLLNDAMAEIDLTIETISARYYIIFVAVVISIIAALLITFVIVSTLRNQISDLAQGANSMSQGELDIKLPKAYKNEMGALTVALAIFRDETKNAREMEEGIRQRAQERAEKAAQLAEEKMEQSKYVAAELERAATAIEQLSTSVNVAAEMAETARDKSTVIKSKSDQGTQTVKNAMSAMGDIRNSSTEISTITKLIDEISFQTNLLALNARVEAARAGSAGRGFAVVAAEVQNLAARSAKAARDISDLIVQSGKQVAVGSEIVNQSGAALDEIAAGIFDVSDAIQVVSKSVREQSHAINEINKTTLAIDDTLKSLLSDAA